MSMINLDNFYIKDRFLNWPMDRVCSLSQLYEIISKLNSSLSLMYLKGKLLKKAPWNLILIHFFLAIKMWSCTRCEWEVKSVRQYLHPCSN